VFKPQPRASKFTLTYVMESFGFPGLSEWMHAEPNLATRRILVAEDDLLIGFDIRLTFVDCGAEVVGPVSDLDSALELVDSEARLDAAILDVNLSGELAFPLADHLIKREVPLVFATAHGADVIPYRLRHVTRFEKPVRSIEMAQVVARLVVPS
jgi:CheY-like chemotaxis protein